MKRAAFFLYGGSCYAVFLATFLYAIGFVEGAFVPRTIDAGGPSAPPAGALVIDALLLGLFAVQHSGMARRGFKRVWTRIVPEPIERSTYVLFASACLIGVYAFWHPIPSVVWDVEQPSMRALLLAVSLTGWAIVLVGTFLIHHFELFGLQQVYLAMRGAELPPHEFRTPALYRVVRHPIYLGFIVAFWATPRMTVGHLLFSILTAGYILVGIQLEERDLVREYGKRYIDYRRRVRALLPIPRGRAAERQAESARAGR